MSVFFRQSPNQSAATTNQLLDLPAAAPAFPPVPGGQLPPVGGDFTLQEVMRQADQRAMLAFRLGTQYYGISTMLAVATERKSFHNYDVGAAMLTAWVDHVNASLFLGVGPGGGNLINGSPRVPLTSPTGVSGPVTPVLNSRD